MACNQLTVMSYGGQRDVIVDASRSLEDGEILIGTTAATSLDTSHLSVAAVNVESTVHVVDGHIYPANQSVGFRLSSLGTTPFVASVKLTIRGNSGTIESFEIRVPIREYVPII